MGHPYAVWLHRVARDVGIVANVGVVEVGDLLVAITGIIQVDRIKRREGRHLGLCVQRTEISLDYEIWH